MSFEERVAQVYVVDLEAIHIGDVDQGASGAYRLPVRFKSAIDEGEAVLTFTREHIEEIWRRIWPEDVLEELETMSHHGRTMSQAEALHQILRLVKEIGKEVKDNMATIQEQFNSLKAIADQQQQVLTVLGGDMQRVESTLAQALAKLAALNASPDTPDFGPLIAQFQGGLDTLTAMRAGVEAATPPPADTTPPADTAPTPPADTPPPTTG